jgi:hypothetical protein
VQSPVKMLLLAQRHFVTTQQFGSIPKGSRRIT